MIIVESINNLKLYKINKTNLDKPETFTYYDKDQYIIEYDNDDSVHRYFNTTEELYQEIYSNKDIKKAVIKKEDLNDSLYHILDLDFYKLIGFETC